MNELSLFTGAGGGGCSGQSSSDGKQLDMSKSTITASESLAGELKTVSLTTPQSLPISKHSLIQDVQSYIEGLRMLLPQVSLANHSQSQERDEGKQGDICSACKYRILSEGSGGNERIPDEPEGLGPTGEYSDGKMSVDDEGEVKIAIGFTEGRVIVNFGTPVSWIGLNPNKAREMARHLLMTADAIDLDRNTQRIEKALESKPTRPE